MKKISLPQQTVFPLDSLRKIWYCMVVFLPVFTLSLTFSIFFLMDIKDIEILSWILLCVINCVTISVWYYGIMFALKTKIILTDTHIRITRVFDDALFSFKEIQWFRILPVRRWELAGIFLQLFLVCNGKKILIHSEYDNFNELQDWIFRNFTNLGKISFEIYKVSYH